jgi:hypothetical protein
MTPLLLRIGTHRGPRGRTRLPAAMIPALLPSRLRGSIATPGIDKSTCRGRSDAGPGPGSRTVGGIEVHWVSSVLVADPMDWGHRFPAPRGEWWSVRNPAGGPLHSQPGMAGPWWSAISIREHPRLTGPMRGQPMKIGRDRATSVDLDEFLSRPLFGYLATASDAGPRVSPI